MSPPRTPLAQSESKARFFDRLGLDEKNEEHRRLYALMKVRISTAVTPPASGADHTTGRSRRRTKTRHRQARLAGVAVPKRPHRRAPLQQRPDQRDGHPTRDPGHLPAGPPRDARRLRPGSRRRPPGGRELGHPLDAVARLPVPRQPEPLAEDRVARRCRRLARLVRHERESPTYALRLLRTHT